MTVWGFWIPAGVYPDLIGAGMAIITASITLILLFFDFLYLVYPGDVPTALELGAEEVLNDNLRLSFTLLRRQAANLGVIMKSGAVSGKNIVALSGPYPFHLIGGDAHADAGAANQDTLIELAPDDSFSHLHGDIGIINRILGIAPEVAITMPRLCNYTEDEFFESTTPVVITDGNTHGKNLLYKVNVIQSNL
jgi:hypothetical protein